MLYRYPPEFRRRVLDVIAAGRSVASVAEDLGARRSTTGGARTPSTVARSLGPAPAEKTETAKGAATDP
jgi:transposase-like protein